MNGKYWQVLLWEWRKKGRSGLSIPYIIGSQHYLPGETVNQNIESLVTDIVENSEAPIYLKYCTYIRDLIFEKLIPGHPGYYPSYRGMPQSKLLVSKFLDDLGETIEELSVILTDRYQRHIDVGNYSINEGERGNYTPEETTFIINCFR